MVSSVVSNPNERLVTSRYDDDVELRQDPVLSSRKSAPRSTLKRVLVALLFLSLVAGASVLSYFLVSKYKSLSRFKGMLSDHLSNDFPHLTKTKRDLYYDELTKLFSDGLISNDAKLEFGVYREFESFNTKYNRVHKTDKDRLSKFVNFRKSYLEVKKQKGNEPYLKGINRFSDLSEKEFYEMFPPMKVPEEKKLPFDLEEHFKNSTYLKNLKRAKNLSEDVDPKTLTGEDLDWRRAFSVSRVKDQQNCGGCWAFSTVGSVESFYMVHHDKTYDLSPQELLDCDAYSNGCKGGFAETAFEYVKKYGLVSSKDLPFVDRQNKCHVPNVNKVFVKEFYVHKGSQVLNTSLTVTPVVVYLAVSPELSKYKSGVYTGGCGNRLNHALLLVGEGYDEATEKRYWVLKNSWGTGWGEEGYLRLERTNKGSDKCGVLDTGLFPYYSSVDYDEYSL